MSKREREREERERGIEKEKEMREDEGEGTGRGGQRVLEERRSRGWSRERKVEKRSAPRVSRRVWTKVFPRRSES